MTRTFLDLQRFTISFKSIQRRNKYSHIVMGVCHRGLFGAIGLSRRSDLMFKPVNYVVSQKHLLHLLQKLSDLIIDFLSAYQTHGHEVVKVNISSPIPHEPHFLETINWKVCHNSFIVWSRISRLFLPLGGYLHWTSMPKQ